MSEAAIVIAGAGEAGVAAAAAIRAAGRRDPIWLVSDEPTLPYERPPLSKAALDETPRSETLIRPGDWYEAEDITLLRSSRVVGVNAAERLVDIAKEDDASVCTRYASLLIATGTRPRRLPDPKAAVHYLRTQADARRLQEALIGSRRIVVIGGGVIGLEVAAAARGRGLEVTVLDPAQRLMARAVAPEISSFLFDLHRRAGVDIRLESGPAQVVEFGEGVVVRADDATFHADLCVVGIGVLPNDELGRLAGCDLDNGILVDGCGRTSVPGVFAAGDVAALRHPHYPRPLRMETWQHAGRHGAHVGRAMIGTVDDYQEVPWFWTDQLGVNVQVAGLPGDCDQTVWRGDGARRTAFHLKEGALCGVTTLDNGRDMRPAINLLAARWSGLPAPLCDPHASLRDISRGLLAAQTPSASQMKLPMMA